MSDQGGNDAGDRDGAAGASGDPRLTAPTDVAQQPRLPFPVVGVGASAGGLEAYIELLQAAPADAGLAWVLIQHLPPDRESLVADILGKKTAMPVLQVEDGVPVRPDHVYVIRPGNTLTIKDGRLRLGAPLEAPGHRRPVDDFFRSLAEEQQQRAVAVVLSGMGSNGSAGAQAIKAVGGLCIAQDPESAKFPSMPRSLIDAHLADYVLRAAEMPEAIARYARHPYAQGDRSAEKVARRATQALQEILAVIRTRTRHDFSGYRKPTLVRRVQRRMGLNQIADMAEYARVLRQTPGEVSALADDLLIHVTGFFRDPEVWDVVRDKVISPLAAGRPDGAPIRAWVAACATGDEACTLAMLLVEAAEAAGKQFDIKVFATDMAERALGQARAGVFPGGIESEVSAERLDRFFDKDDATYRVKKALRELVVFAPQNVLQDPPFSRLDIITCRNFLIYLEPDVQRRVLALLHFGLREGGALLLGTSETVGAGEGEFEPIDKKHRLYRRVGPTRHGALDFSALAAPAAAGEANGERAARPQPRAPVAQLVNRALLDHHTPAAVVVDRDGQIVYFHGDTGPYLDQPRGEPSRDLIALANDHVRGSLRTAFHKAVTTGGPVAVRDGLIDTPDGRRRVEVRVTPLDRRTGQALYLVVLADHPERPAPEAAGDPAGGQKLVDDLQRARDELQSTIEELQTSNEELKASHEEVTSINEELQSTNEELETSKEEMQSLNEELTTVNAQLQAKMDELERTSNDLASLLASTDLAVIFLDTKFRIRRFTPAVRDLIDLIASDVGRPVLDLRRKFDDPGLLADAQFVLDRLVPVEKEVAGEGGRAYLRRVTPYRTTDNRIDGVVVTFVDITQRRADEAALRASEEQFRRAIEEAPIPVIMHAEDGEVLQISRTWTELTGYALPDVPTVDAWLTRAYGPGADAVRTHMQELFSGDRRTLDVEFTIRTRGGADRHWSFSAGAPGALADGRRFVVGMAVDITDRQQAEAALRESRAFHELVADLGSDWWFSARIDPDGTAVTEAVGGGFTRLLGYTRDELMAAGGWAVIVHPDDRPEAGRQMARLLAGETIDGELRHVARDGRVSWSQYRTRPEADAAGRVVRVYGVARDITDRKRVDEALRAGEERFRRLAETVPQIVWTSVGGAVDYYNPRWYEYTGRGPAADPDGWPDVIHPDDQPEALRRGAETLRTGDPYEIEYRLRRADGAYRWHIARAVRVPGSDRWIGTATDIHDLKTADEVLRASEGRLRAVAANLPGGAVFVVGPDLRYELAEGQGLRDAGFTAADYEGKTLAEALPPDLAAASEANCRRALGGEPFLTEHAAGDRRFVTRGVPLRDPDGRVTAALVVSYDITDRVRAEGAVRASEERLRLLVESVRDHAILALDPDGRVTSWNPAAERVFGYAADEIVGRSGEVIFTPEDRAAGLPGRELATAAAEGRATDENWAVRKDGSRFWASGVSSAVRDPDGRLTGFVKVLRDRTEARQAAAAVQQAEERLRLALGAARMGIWTWDPAAGTQTRDGNMNRLLGLPAGDTTQPFGDFLARIHPDDRPEVAGAFAFAAEYGQPLNLEFRVVRPDGAVRWFRDQGDVFGGAGGPARQLTGAVVDVTERREAEEAVRRARDELEVRVRERTAELAEALVTLRDEAAARRELAGRLSAAQEDERRRLARELHDSVGQYLAALAVGLKAAEAEAGAASPAAGR
ncbi:MAG: PAS domain S-box protein, partial [Gemmataceae bacterium]|nr:PAS domain S-box protein [Gemmataceae bacterium]